MESYRLACLEKVSQCSSRRNRRWRRRFPLFIMFKEKKEIGEPLLHGDGLTAMLPHRCQHHLDSCNSLNLLVLILKRFHISPHPHHNFIQHTSRLNTFHSSHSLIHSNIHSFTFTFSITQSQTQASHHFTQHSITFIDSFTRPLNHKHKYQLTSTHH